MEEVIAAKHVMRQSLFSDETTRVPEVNLVDEETLHHTSSLVAYALPGVALLVALIALAVALFR